MLPFDVGRSLPRYLPERLPPVLRQARYPPRPFLLERAGLHVRYWHELELVFYPAYVVPVSRQVGLGIFLTLRASVLGWAENPISSPTVPTVLKLPPDKSQRCDHGYSPN